MISNFFSLIRQRPTFPNATGVQLDTNYDWPGVGGVSYIDPSLHIYETSYFETMIEYFETTMGYERGVSVHGAGYDWRLAPDGLAAPGGYYDRLAQLIESTVIANGATAHLITHSMGGPIALAFLQSRDAAWLKSNIATYVPLSPPFGGVPSIFRTFVSGDDMVRQCVV